MMNHISKFGEKERSSYSHSRIAFIANEHNDTNHPHFQFLYFITW